MPEQLTKHPEVTLQVLRSAGASCGAGEPQQILTQCPPSRFCKLPGGEICVYGLPEARQMTQIGAAEWQAVAAPGAPPPRDAGPGVEVVVAVVAALALGAVAGAVWGRRRTPPA